MLFWYNHARAPFDDECHLAYPAKDGSCLIVKVPYEPKRIELTVLQLTKILCSTLLPHRSKVFVYFYFCLEVTCSV